MADSLVRLRIDSQEYDQKLKRASEGLSRYIDGCRKAGGTLEHVDDGVMDFVRSLGKMETVSTSAKGSLNEMSKVFTDLTMQLNGMSKAEKNAEFGKALSEGLDQLKDRIIDTKSQLADIQDSLKIGGGGTSTGGLFGGGKLDGMLQVFGGNLMTKGFEMATSAALNFISSVKDAAAQGIEMAKAGEGVRMAFDRLNRPDLLDNLRQATHNTVTDLELMKQAVKFNDFNLNLEEMGTLLQFAQQKAKDTGQSVDYMVDSIVTGLGRQSLQILDNLGLSASEVRERMKETGDMTSAVASIIRDQMQSAGDYVETAADRAAKADVELKNAMEDLGRTLLPLEEQGTQMWTALEVGALNILNDGLTPLVPAIISLKENIGELYDTIENSTVTSGFIDWLETGLDITTRFIPKLAMLRKLMSFNGEDLGAGAGLGVDAITEALTFDLGNLPEVTVNGHRRRKGGISNANMRQNSDEALRDRVMSQWKNQDAKAYLEEQERWKRQNYVALPDTKGISGLTQGYVDQTISDLQKKLKNIDLGSDAFVKIQEQLANATDIKSMMEASLASGINIPEDIREQMMEGLFDGEIPQETIDKWKEQLEDIGIDFNKDKGKEDQKEKKASEQLSKIAEPISKFSAGLSSINSGLKTLGIDLGEGFNNFINTVNAISQVISGVASIISVFEVGALTANTIALNTNTAMLAASRFIPFFAKGGIAHAANGFVPGNDHKDGIPVMVSSGELILNRAQQGVLASQLEGGGALGNLELSTYVTGEQLAFVLNNRGKRTGRGEYVQSNRR